MKTIDKRPRKLMRIRNKNQVSRIKNQQFVFAPLFILVLIRLGLEEQTTPEKLLARLRMHIEKLTGNLNFPITVPSIANLQTMADDLQSDIDNIAAGNKALIPHRNVLVKDGKEMIRQLSYNIQYLSEGDEVEIKSAGFDVRKAQGPTQAPGQILNIVAKPVGPGKIKLTWDRDNNSLIYVIEQQSNTGIPPLPMWDVAGKTRNVSFVVENLNPGTVYYFRVFGTNGNEDGNPSDPAEQRSL